MSNKNIIHPEWRKALEYGLANVHGTTAEEGYTVLHLAIMKALGTQEPKPGEER